jgi:hypothetical protein
MASLLPVTARPTTPSDQPQLRRAIRLQIPAFPTVTDKLLIAAASFERAW